MLDFLQCVSNYNLQHGYNSLDESHGKIVILKKKKKKSHVLHYCSFIIYVCLICKYLHILWNHLKCSTFFSTNLHTCTRTDGRTVMQLQPWSGSLKYYYDKQKDIFLFFYFFTRFVFPLSFILF